jgi:Spy/CpxP family protein refolding chaperone
MKKVHLSVLLLSLLGAPAALAAQEPGARPPRGEHRGGRGERAPFALLLRHRAELGLTGEQVARLEQIGRDVETRNAPLRARLREAHGRYVAERREQIRRLTPEQRRDTLRRLRAERKEKGRRIPEEMRPLVSELRENTRQAMEEAKAVLTPEQKERARALMAAERARRHEQRSRRGPHSGRPRS